jgi:hypothetical protein
MTGWMLTHFLLSFCAPKSALTPARALSRTTCAAQGAAQRTRPLAVMMGSCRLPKNLSLLHLSSATMTAATMRPCGHQVFQGCWFGPDFVSTGSCSNQRCPGYFVFSHRGSHAPLLPFFLLFSFLLAEESAGKDPIHHEEARFDTDCMLPASIKKRLHCCTCHCSLLAQVFQSPTWLIVRN